MAEPRRTEWQEKQAARKAAMTKKVEGDKPTSLETMFTVPAFTAETNKWGAHAYL